MYLLYSTCDLSVGQNVHSKITEKIFIAWENIIGSCLDYFGLSFYIGHKYFLKLSNLLPTPSLVCSNTLPLSPFSLCLSAIPLSPYNVPLSIWPCHVQYSWSFNKCILKRVALISKVAPTKIIIKLMMFKKDCVYIFSAALY
jgi:hypothetical protein